MRTAASRWAAVGAAVIGLAGACRDGTLDDRCEHHGTCPPAGRLFALMNMFLDPPATPASIEVVDLVTMSLLDVIPLGDRSVNSLAVTHNGRTAFVSDTVAGEVAIYDTVTGSLRTTIPVPGAFDIVLSPDEATLYSSSTEAVVAIATATSTVVAKVDLPGKNPSTLAITPDGARLGVLSTGGVTSDLFLFDTRAQLTLSAVVSFGSGDPYCDALFNDLVFDGPRVLIWDGGCDALYQVDLATRAQLPSTTIHLPRDSGTSVLSNNAVVPFPKLARVAVVKEFNEMIAFDPAAETFTVAATFTDDPLVGARAPDGVTAFVALLRPREVVVADTLDRINLATGVTRRSVYEFSDATKRVRDLTVVAP
jgi:DNA-binding beta-propeller fold protein YncE